MLFLEPNPSSLAPRLHDLRDMDINESKSLPSDNATEALALEDYDLVILDDGTGATIAAWTFASQEQRVAVIDRKYIGGSCPNIEGGAFPKFRLL
jgi:ribulose 1,5-bisphosphate synthetase/thiazole synthase